MEIPAELKRAILANRCIAFVGAGFARPAIPSWPDLLRAVEQRLQTGIEISANPNALELEAYGQLLQDAAGARWKQVVREAMGSPSETDRATLQRRRSWLMSIPFKAILTTNFDDSLTGEPTDHATYWRVLRDEGRASRPPVIKLHGDLDGDAPLVFSRKDYRDLVYGDGKYTNFIRAAFARYTVLFLGVSFTDAYLNELRSEVLNLLHYPARGEPPWGYAIQMGANAKMIDFFARHESIQTLPAADPAGVDKWIEAIAGATSLRGRLRALLHDKLIVWVDPHPDNNDRAHDMLDACGARLVTLARASELTDEHAHAALILSHFGRDPDGDHAALQVLERVRQWRERPPVLVFASHNPMVPVNRALCLRHGALEYAVGWQELYLQIESIFGRLPGY